MVTTIIAIYGAVLATVSTVLGAWYFLRSGPILQADANVELEEGWNDDSFILLRVWNNGRAEITVRITYLIISHGKKHLLFPLEGSDLIGAKSGVRIGINGPEVSIRISGHSGEFWYIDGGFDIRSITPFTTGKLSFLLMVGGNRAVKVPVMDGTYRRIKRRFILNSTFAFFCVPCARVPRCRDERDQFPVEGPA
jgi:hypothetical protein